MGPSRSYDYPFRSFPESDSAKGNEMSKIIFNKHDGSQTIVERLEAEEAKKNLQKEGIILEFHDDANLFNRILESARRNRRPAGSEVLYLLEQAVDRGLAGESVSIDKVLKIISKVKNYPIPEGSPKDVFAKALEIISLRLQELKE